MRWDDFRRSENIEDRREDDGGGGGGGFGIPGGRGGLGIGTVVVLGLVGWALGIDPRLLIGGAEVLTRGGGGYEQQRQAAARRAHERHEEERSGLTTHSPGRGSRFPRCDW